MYVCVYYVSKYVLFRIALLRDIRKYVCVVYVNSMGECIVKIYFELVQYTFDVYMYV